MKLLSWFDAHKSFDFEEPQLKNLFTGVVASAVDGVKCVDTENVEDKFKHHLIEYVLKEP